MRFPIIFLKIYPVFFAMLSCTPTPAGTGQNIGKQSAVEVEGQEDPTDSENQTETTAPSNEQVKRDGKGASQAPVIPAMKLPSSEADKNYLNHWLNDAKGREWLSTIGFMLPIINDSGELNVCIRLDLRGQVTVNQDQIERIINQNLIGYNSWLRFVAGYEGFNRKETKINVFGLALTPSVVLSGVNPSYVQYKNENAECPATCSRFVQKGNTALDFSQCPQKNKFFDMVLWFSDHGDFAPELPILGHSGDWGARLSWQAAKAFKLNQLEPGNAFHIGMTFGLDGVFSFPEVLAGHKRPESVMAAANAPANFDGLMLREAWNLQKARKLLKP